MKRALFINPEGTIFTASSESIAQEELDTFEFLPFAITGLTAIAKDAGLDLILLCDPGLRKSPWKQRRYDYMTRILSGEGVTFTATVDCLASKDLTAQYDSTRSFLLAGSQREFGLAEELGCRTLVFCSEERTGAVLATTSWIAISDFLIAQNRYGEYSRTTTETSVEVSVSLYGSGVCSIKTGLGFFDHMLNLLGSHAGFNLSVAATGDLWVDEHHLIEDVGIVLGEAIARALGERRGITRFGFTLPMDESLARVAIDLAARCELVWQASFSRERIGDMPTEMFKHFFKSLVESLRCSLHIAVEGDNEHHKIEAIFKGVGRCLRTAVNRDRLAKGVPSTKGVL